MRCFRLVKARHALEAFTGAGARVYGGRWNRPGIPMVYAAQSLALAALETVVHFSGEERGIAFVAYEIDVPDECVKSLDGRDLPRDWRSTAIPASTQGIGTDWQRARSSVAFRVPSVLVPGESCVLLNPEHPDTRRVTIDYPSAFTFDERLWK